jgi:hypothetical protein
MAAVSVIMSLTCFVLPAFATETSGSFEGTNIAWTFDSSTGVVEITGNGDLPITKLSDTPWVRQTDIKKVIIGNGITSTGKYAFAQCTNLETVEISSSSSLATIGAAAFNGCSHLNSMTLPASLQSIQASAFANTSISFGMIPKGCAVANGAIPNTCRYIVNDARISSGSIICNSGSGYTCTYADGSLTIGVVGETSPGGFYQSIVTFMINGQGIAATDVTSMNFEQSGSITSLSSYKNLQSVNIGAGITEISVGAFDSLSKLKAIAFAENSQLTTVGSAAFRNCSALTSIDFTKCTKLTCIGTVDDTAGDGNSPFQSCTSLTSIVFPSSLERLGGYALNGCTALETVDLSGTKLTSIGASAFQTCTALKTVLVPATLETLSLSQNNYDCEIVVCGASKAPECLGGSSDLHSTITWSSDKTVTVTVPQVLVDQVSAVSVTKDNYTEAAAALDAIQVSYNALSDAAKSVIKADFETAMAAKRAQQVFLSAGTTNLKYGDTFTVNVDEAALTAAMSATFTESTNLKLVKIEKSDALSGTNLSFDATLEGEKAGLFSFFGNEAAGSGTVVTATFECVGTGDATVGMGDVTVGKSVDVTEYDVADPDPLKLYIALKGAKGDLNGDGVVNIVDAQIAFDLATGKYDEGSPYEAIIACWAEQKADLSTIKTFADVNGDGELDAADARAIQYAIHNGGFAA